MSNFVPVFYFKAAILVSGISFAFLWVLAVLLLSYSDI